MTALPRHALITGGSRGIGLAIAHLLARNNHRITLLSRSESSLQAALASLPPPESPHQHAYIAADITSPDFWTKPNFSKHQQPLKSGQLPRIDVLVNCAGISQSSFFTRTEPEYISEIVDTNLKSLMLGTRFLLRNRYIQGTRKANGEPSPVIINVSSLLGVKGGYGAVAYAASKAGVLGFTRALAVEQGPLGVRVNAIVPGYVETDMTKDLDYSGLEDKIPLKRLGQPEEIASAALFLIQNQYAHNCVINIDGGLSAV